MNFKITGTGSYIPNVVTRNADFEQHEFFNLDGSSFPQDNGVFPTPDGPIYW